jgi:very-short-patch-repair endonuclease
LPTHYKIDIALPARLLAVEVDGQTHNALKVRAADKRKDAFLRSCGWTVLRVRNARVLNDLPGVLKEIRVVLRSTT